VGRAEWIFAAFLSTTTAFTLLWPISYAPTQKVVLLLFSNEAFAGRFYPTDPLSAQPRIRAFKKQVLNEQRAMSNFIQ
jgi:hypothetical protein